MEIHKLDEVWTADQKKLGVAHHLHHALGEVNPDLKLYASYLEVESFELGDDYFIPTDFIAGRDPAGGRVNLDATLKKVLEETWVR
ncbi:MAG: hypothetical protein AB1791_02880, partial [Chloroflexota bacterium]